MLAGLVGPAEVAKEKDGGEGGELGSSDYMCCLRYQRTRCRMQRQMRRCARNSRSLSDQGPAGRVLTTSSVIGRASDSRGLGGEHAGGDVWMQRRTRNRRSLRNQRTTCGVQRFVRCYASDCCRLC